jgi:hypothetical protein
LVGGVPQGSLIKKGAWMDFLHAALGDSMILGLSTETSKAKLSWFSYIAMCQKTLDSARSTLDVEEEDSFTIHDSTTETMSDKNKMEREIREEKKICAKCNCYKDKDSLQLQ